MTDFPSPPAPLPAGVFCGMELSLGEERGGL
jgi:hypothetical protein